MQNLGYPHGRFNVIESQSIIKHFDLKLISNGNYNLSKSDFESLLPLCYVILSSQCFTPLVSLCPSLIIVFFFHIALSLVKNDRLRNFDFDAQCHLGCTIDFVGSVQER